MLVELRIIACAAMLALAAVIDIKKREIPDMIWVGFGAFGALLAILQFTSGADDSLFGGPPTSANAFIAYLLGIGIITPVGYAVYKTGLFGGADSKALIAIAVLMPTYDGMLFKLHGLPALTALTNALFISLSQLVVNTARNLVALSKGIPIFEGIEEGTTRKALAFAIGYRTTTTSAQGYVFPMEGIDESGKRRFAFNPRSYNEFVGEEEDEEHNDDRGSEKPLWVTQALPFIVYIAIGFGIMLTLGDIFGAIILNIW